MTNTLCAICRNAAARDLIDGALIAGSTPAAVFAAYGASLQVSRSGVYRHAAHRHALAPVGAQYVGGTTTTGIVVEGLAELRRSLAEQRADALARGQHAVANQTAQRFESVSVALLREAGVTEESQARRLANAEEFEWVIGRAAATSPEVGDYLAGVADALGYEQLATEIRQTAEKHKEIA